jgi:hypothetical protein
MLQLAGFLLGATAENPQAEAHATKISYAVCK